MFTRIVCLLFLSTIAIRMTAQLPTGNYLFPAELTQLKPVGPNALDAVVAVTAVEGQPFASVWKVNTFNRPSPKVDYGFNAPIHTALKKGDVLWISFKARSLQSKRETGESFIELRFDQLVNGKYLWPSYLERGISIGTEWTETSIPFVMTKDARPDEVQFVIKFDTYPQEFQLGPVRFINYGPDVKLSDLPRSVVHYGGDEPDAPWRKAAAERIEKYRKGDLSVQVTDKNGNPLPGAAVEVHMARNAFNWGTATTSQMLTDTGADSRRYQDTLRKYFNQVVFENEIKSKNWSRFNYDQSLKGINWLRNHHIPVRGHVMVWPSWQHSAASLAAYKNDTAALRAAILKQIKEQTTTLKGWFTEWDVVNEPYAHDDFLELLGRQEMVKWFQAARENTPGVKLFLNDYTMFHGEGPNSPSEKFYDNVKFLLDNGAPVNAIGEQAHIGGTPPPIPKIVERLDYFSKLGLPIQISEFDINSNDDEFKARYLGDFITAVYSHPATTGVVQWGFWEGLHWFPVAALWDKDWNVRAHGKIFTQLVNKTWKTDAAGITGADGIYKTRGYTGEYEITVNYKGTITRQNQVLGNKGNSVTVKVK